MSYKRQAIQAARRYFKNPRDRRIFLRQMGAEANFQDATSPAGAQGPAQIMPATAKSWGVKNVHDPVEAYDAAARNMATYLRQYGGSWAKALTAYNAGPGAVGRSLPGETRAYISKILGGRDVRAGRVSAAGLRGGAGGSYTRGQAPLLIPGQTKVDETGALVDALLSGGSPTGLLKRYQALIDTGNYTSTTAPRVQNAKLAKYREGSPIEVTGGGGGGGGAAGGARGQFKITGPNPGRIKPEVREFVSHLAGVFGQPIVGSDGSGHSKYTVNGNVSEHFTGNATDIRARGQQLIKMGQDALIAAGMSPRKARRVRGGLFNMTWKGRRVQIIFNTQVGGDHTDHLHVGVH